MKVDIIREKFLEFFRKKGHTTVSSDSLIPQGDPSLLFTGSGMNQFKENFLGVNRALRRAASSQKCLRTGDLDEVGKTPYHHSFFEMLGNFSFGDYFKEEAIQMAWEFLTGDLNIPVDRLRISVHEKDEKAFQIWRDKIKIREKWIYKCGDQTNFWPSNAPLEGPNGPCGPCSEIYFDQNPEEGHRDISDKSFAEMWNLVFTQYDRQDEGKLIPLAQKNIDTGMGLERLACVLQNKKTNYEIDIFADINQSIEQLLRVSPNDSARMALYAISDHARAVTFAIHDGVIPSNEGRGYVIRKLIRRALWQAHQLTPSKKLEQPFLYQVVPAIVNAMKKPYPELLESAKSIQSTLRGEEERFLETLETGLVILEGKLRKFANKKSRVIPGEIVFELYDTYGFPDELTKVIAEERGLQIDREGFEQLMEEQRNRAKKASPISKSIFSASDLDKDLSNIPLTKFLGHDLYETKANVLYTRIQNNRGIVILDQTPFYAESGGQVADRGMIHNENFEAIVKDVQKKHPHFLHLVELQRGEIRVGDTVYASIDSARRLDIMRNHTATHLLHSALRQLLGSQVRQLGSLVSTEKLRFDYSYPKALSTEQIRGIESLVNEKILQNANVSKTEKSFAEAKKEGALAFFGEKYAETVRVVSAGDFSSELCGGTHCNQTGQIGIFLITSDSAIASGTRRIEALTGRGALSHIRQSFDQIRDLSNILKTSPETLAVRIAKLQDNLKKLEKEKKKGGLAKFDVSKILDQARKIGGYRFIQWAGKDISPQDLRGLSDQIRTQSEKIIYFLAAENQDKIQFVIGASLDLVKSGFDVRPLAKKLADVIGADSGGSAGLVQGGIPSQGQLEREKMKLEETARTYFNEI